MRGPEPQKRVNVVQQAHGIFVPISRTHLEDAGVDPDDPDLEVSRYAFEDDGAIRLRFYDDSE